jgi:hypothetical protein
VSSQPVAIDDINSICLNYIEQNKSLTGDEVSITFNQLHFGPDVINCLKKTGYMPPAHSNEFIALVEDLLKLSKTGVSVNKSEQKQM